jgi:SAM-dependent methyltransferase
MQHGDMPAGKRNEAAIPLDHYRVDQYDSLRRFVSYWHQIDEIRRRRPARVMEIGVGNGFVSRYLKERGFNVVTLDVNPQLQPDVSGSATTLPFADGTFDVVAAFEVLEHLPPACAMDALRELRRVMREVAVVSVPDRRLAFPLQVTIPGLGPRHWLLQCAFDRIKGLDPDHYWEIGRRDVSPRTFREWVGAAELRIEYDYRLFHSPYHHFYVLTPR